MQLTSKRILICCVLVALVLRLAWVLFGFPYLQPRWHLRDDADNYQALAQSIRDGQYTDVTRGPLYPAFLAVVGSPMRAKLIQAFLDTAICAFVYFLAAGLVRHRGGSHAQWTVTGLWAAALWAVYPFAIWRVAFLNKEAVLPFLLAGYMCAQVVALRSSRAGAWIGAALVLSLAVYCKPTFLLWPVVLVGVLWLVKALSTRVVCLFVVLALMIAPWTYRNYVVTGGAIVPVATEYGGKSTFVGNYQPSLGAWEGPGKPLWMAAEEEIVRQNPDASVVDLDRAFYRAAWHQIGDNPLRAAEIFVRKAGRFWFLSQAYRVPWSSILIQGFYLGLALVGLWCLRPLDVAPALFLALILYVWAVYTLSLANLRYSVDVVPYVCLFAAWTLGKISCARRDFSQ